MVCRTLVSVGCRDSPTPCLLELLSVTFAYKWLLNSAHLMDLLSQCISNFFFFCSKTFFLNKTLPPSPAVKNKTVLVRGGQGIVWKGKDNGWVPTSHPGGIFWSLLEANSGLIKSCLMIKKDTDLGKGRELRFWGTQKSSELKEGHWVCTTE